MTEKLKPCPFCGSEKIYIDMRDVFNEDETEYFYTCKNCGATAPACIDDNDALKAWNTRAYENA